MNIIVVSRDTPAGQRLVQVCRQALPRAESACAPQGDRAFELALRGASLVLCREDADLQKVLELAPQRAVIVIGSDPGTEARVHAIRRGAAEYLAEDELAPALLARVAHYVMEVQQLQARNEALVGRLDYLSGHDALTGAHNRCRFFVDLADLAEQALVEGERLAVMLIKLDGFRGLNDTLGQQAGDAVLKVMAQRVAHVLRDADRLYRIDGSQFAVIVRQADDELGLKQAGARILAAAGRPLNVFTQRVECGMSIGVARWPLDADSSDALVTVADAALRAARAEGGGLRIADATMVPPRLGRQPESPLTRH